MSDWPFVQPDRVPYADLDTMRHLNNVAFVRFFESARIAFMQAERARPLPERIVDRVSPLLASRPDAVG